MADPVVHITNGIPDSGTGNITTLGMVLAVLPAALGANGGLKIDGSGTAIPISGSVSITGTPTISGTVTANAGTNLNTSLLALEAGGNLAQIVTQLGSVSASPPANTVNDRLKTINTTLGSPFQAGGSIANTSFAATQSGVWTVQPGNTQNTTPWLVRINDGTTSADVKAASTAAVAADKAVVVAISPNNYDFGSGTGGSKTQRVIMDSSQLTAQGQVAMAASDPVVIASDQKWQTGMSPRAFSAAFSTLTRPANTTPYSAADSISDNATAGSVTALSATLSDVNDDPITITDILVSSTDTGLAGKKIRAYLFNSDPTANTGVGAGDNTTYSQKKAGYIGSFMGWMETGFSDGTVGRLIPTFNETNNTQAGGFIVTKPTSGAKTLYIQYQAVEIFTPSGNSTTIIGTARGFQGRAS